MAKPIIFSAPMIQALLAGTKTQTRRAMKSQPEHCISLSELHRTYPASYPNHWAEAGASIVQLRDGEAPYWECPYGTVGDLIWVRESWAADSQVDSVPPRQLSKGEPIFYPADGSVRETGCSMIAPGKSRPSIHMPRWASRLTLRITDVRVQRLQGISGADAVDEGALSRLPDNGIAQSQFQDMWASIYGPDSWHTNPWVWAISFDVIQANVDTVLREQAA